MLHTKIPANCVDRLFTCYQSIDFGNGPVPAPGYYRPNSLNSTPASIRGKLVDELAKNKFFKALYYETQPDIFRALITKTFKEPKEIDGVTYCWGDRNSEYQLLGDKASQFMLNKLKDCDELFCDRYDDLVELFEGIPEGKIYTNQNGIRVCYNSVTDTEFAFGASVDFGGTRDNTAYLIELKTGTGFGKNLETQLKVSAVACILNHPETERVICGCYNVDSDDYKEWSYTKEDLMEYRNQLRYLLLKIYLDTQPDYITGMEQTDWCKMCDCKRCPYSRYNKNNSEFKASWQEKADAEAQIFSTF